MAKASPPEPTWLHKIGMDVAKAILTAAILGTLSWLGWVHWQLVGLQNHLATLSADVTRLTGDKDALAQEHDSLVKAHNSLRTHVTVLYDRQPKGPTNLPEVVVHRGRVLALTPDSVTLLPPELGEPATRYRFGKDAAVGEGLKVGADAEVQCQGGAVTRVSAKAADKK